VAANEGIVSTGGTALGSDAAAPADD